MAYTILFVSDFELSNNPWHPYKGYPNTWWMIDHLGTEVGPFSTKAQAQNYAYLSGRCQ
jgi:hypothetical protein